MATRTPQNAVILTNRYLNWRWSINLLLGILLLGQSTVRAQDRQEKVDFQLWVGTKFTTKISKFWEVNLLMQSRMKSNATKLDRVFGELEAYYNLRFHPIVKPMKIGVGLRYIGDDGNNDEIRESLRLHVDIEYKRKIKRFDISYRARYQIKISFTKEPPLFKNVWAHDIRNLIKVGYNVKKWKLDPVIWFELFHHDEVGVFNGFTKYRVGFKTDYDFGKGHKIGGKYFVEMETRYYAPKITHVVALSYRYVWKFKKKKTK